MIIFGHKKLQFEKFQKAVDSLFVPPPKTPFGVQFGVHEALKIKDNWWQHPLEQGFRTPHFKNDSIGVHLGYMEDFENFFIFER